MTSRDWKGIFLGVALLIGGILVPFLNISLAVQFLALLMMMAVVMIFLFFVSVLLEFTRLNPLCKKFQGILLFSTFPFALGLGTAIGLVFYYAK